MDLKVKDCDLPISEFLAHLSKFDGQGRPNFYYLVETHKILNANSSSGVG